MTLDDLLDADDDNYRVRDLGGHLFGTLALPVDETGEDISAWFADTEDKADKTQQDGSTLFIASTADVDRMGDIVEQSWRLKNYRANPVILAEHGAGMDGPTVVGRGIAKIVGRGTPEAALHVRVLWDESDLNPKGQLYAHQHRNGFRRASSVGFRPGKSISRKELPDDHPGKVAGDVPTWRAGRVFSHNELLEHSAVAVPANPAALQLNSYLQTVEDPDEQIRSFFSETVEAQLANKLRHLAEHDEGFRALVRALIWGAPVPQPTNRGGDLAHLFAEEG